MTDNQETKTNQTAADEGLPTAACYPPLFFAGYQHTEDNVSGGTADNIKDAILDYFNNYADDEMNYLLDGVSEEVEIEIWSCIQKNEAIEKHLSDEEWDDDWHYMLDKLVKKVKCLVTRNSDDSGWHYSKGKLRDDADLADLGRPMHLQYENFLG
ncbi:hypothetical protein JIN77_02205 [Verrucomicrobiaceae bacterium R5-34]|nr:hypothetical protein [Verrucomicrobiaceae bacterium R5-34]